MPLELKKVQVDIVESVKVDIIKLDKIIKKTVEAIDNSRSEIYDIYENARKECKRLDEELKELKEQVSKVIAEVETLENGLKASKRRLALINQNFATHTQEELKKAYDEADYFRVELAVKREMEKNLIKRRNELEVRIKDAYVTMSKADNLINQVGLALGYLTGDLQNVSNQLEDLRQKQLLGIKIIKAQEEERRRVAREIHDGPAQLMSNVVLKADLCERMIDVDLDKAKGELSELKEIVRDSLQDVRRIIYNLRPMSLDDLGLEPTLKKYFENFQEETGISVTFQTRGVVNELTSVISLTLFRIVQESLSNVKKHSKASNVFVNFEVVNDFYRLYIFDDGIGFDTEKLKENSEDISSGFGLVSMRERIELLDGEIDIKSEPGKGTRINIKIPFEQNKGDTYEGSN